MSDVEEIQISLDQYADIVASYRGAHVVRAQWKPYEDRLKKQLMPVFEQRPELGTPPTEAGTINGFGVVSGQPSLNYQVVSYYSLDLVRLTLELPDVVAAYKTKLTTSRKLLVVQ